MVMQAQAPAAPAVAQARPQQFFMRLIPPRPNFASTLTQQELDVMQHHAAYWAEEFKTGKVLVIGPVSDPKGDFGMAVLECASLAEAQAMADNDPSVKSGMNRVEIVPMHVFLRKKD